MGLCFGGLKGRTAVARKPSDVVGLKLRVREHLRRQVEKSAKSRDVSLNSEIIWRLEDSFAHENWREHREWLILALTAGLGSQPQTAAKIKAAMDQLMRDADQDLLR
jgi:hypothetical protein